MLRNYQSSLISEIKRSPGRRRLAVMPTGAGKTVCMSHLASEYNEPEVLIAHRQELVGQISMALGKQGLEHRIMAPNKTIAAISARHVKRLGKSWVRHNAPTGVAGVDTLIRREGDPWLKTVRRWQTDEAHHLQPDNKWGKACAMLGDEIEGVGWSATPLRSDGKPLDTCFDDLIVGPSMRSLINDGYLCDYQIYGLPNAIDVSDVGIGANGDFNQAKLSRATERSGITGDAVKHYLTIAKGKRCVGFMVDVKAAVKLADLMKAAGVRAATLHAKTPDAERVAILEAFEVGDLDYIANVDVLGEGFDCPAIEVVQMLRPTASYGLYVQQFGRALRLLAGKLFGIILDHVGNVARHGLPDRVREWSLAGRPRRKAEAEFKINVCGECMMVYEGYEPECPYCGWKPERRESAGRERPAEIAGDLTLYTPDELAQLRGEIERIAGPLQAPPGLKGLAGLGAAKQWNARRDAQKNLRGAIDTWGGYWTQVRGDSVQAAYRRFHHRFGMDTLEALQQSGPTMAEMFTRLEDELRAYSKASES